MNNSPATHFDVGYPAAKKLSGSVAAKLSPGLLASSFLPSSSRFREINAGKTASRYPVEPAV